MELFIPAIQFVNSIINDPGVRPTAEPGTNELDCSAIFNDHNSQLVACQSGVALFRRTTGAEYQGHIFCLPSLRGSEALAFGRAAVGWLFTGPQASRLVAGVPLVLPAARFYCRKLGLTPTGRDLFNEYFSMEASSWAA